MSYNESAGDGCCDSQAEGIAPEIQPVVVVAPSRTIAETKKYCRH